MGGDITVEIKKNAGSSFTVVLPLETASEKAPAGEDAAEDFSLAGKRVLVAEDIQINAGELYADLKRLISAAPQQKNS